MIKRSVLKGCGRACCSAKESGCSVPREAMLFLYPSHRGRHVYLLPYLAPSPQSILVNLVHRLPPPSESLVRLPFRRLHFRVMLTTLYALDQGHRHIVPMIRGGHQETPLASCSLRSYSWARGRPYPHSHSPIESERCERRSISIPWCLC